LLAAVTTIYIDVLHDADIGVSPEQSDKKLVNIPYVIKTFQSIERLDAVSSREVRLMTFSETVARALTDPLMWFIDGHEG
jgi:hypothetical protein